MSQETNLENLCLCECAVRSDEFDIHWHNLAKCAEQCDCSECPCPDEEFDPNDYDESIPNYQY